jgi:hypothetical protein
MTYYQRIMKKENKWGKKRYRILEGENEAVLVPEL